MRIKLEDGQMRAIKDESDLVVNGEIWEYVCQDGEREEDENGRYYTHIFKRPSDGKFFRITIFYCRYSYKDYGYENYLQDMTAYEVEKKEITMTQWVDVKN